MARLAGVRVYPPFSYIVSFVQYIVHNIMKRATLDGFTRVSCVILL